MTEVRLLVLGGLGSNSGRTSPMSVRLIPLLHYFRMGPTAAICHIICLGKANVHFPLCLCSGKGTEILQCKPADQDRHWSRVKEDKRMTCMNTVINNEQMEM